MKIDETVYKCRKKNQNVFSSNHVFSRDVEEERRDGVSQGNGKKKAFIGN